MTVPMPPRIAALPRTASGLPIPWFVPVVDGKPEFRAASAAKVGEALKGKRCWVCGQPNGVYLCHVVGVQTTLSGDAPEPPCHMSCAEYAVQTCPFLLGGAVNDRPNPEGYSFPADATLDGNDMVAIWATRDSRLFRRGERTLFEMAAPTSLSWWAGGRRAARHEILAAYDRAVKDIAARIQANGTAVDVRHLERMIMTTHAFIPNP